MKVTEKYKVEVERERVLEVKCDRCGGKVEPEIAHTYDRRKFELRFTEGHSYPDGGDDEGWEVTDLCNACVQVLKSILESNGFKISKVEIYW